jgi:Kef-type K+ transport system membrane component KefB
VLVFDLKVVLFLQVILVVGLPMMLWGPAQLGRFFPLPIIQIFAGIMLGPSIFGAIAPDLYQFFFRKEVLAGVDTLANVALVLFVFLAGCELDRQTLGKAAGMVFQTSITGVGLTWALGTLAAWGLISLYPTSGLIGTLDNRPLYAIAFGLCMAVTALPVLVVILRELGFNTQPIGTIALAVGACDDALLWSSLAVLLPFAAGQSSPFLAFVLAISGGILTILLLTRVITPLLERWIKNEAPERLLISCAILALFFAAALNEATQLHAAIGAFLAGLLLPEKLRHMCQDRLDTPVTLLLLPFLFLATGLKTNFSFSDPTVWIVALLAFVVCVTGKFIGIAGTARLYKESVPFAVTLGTLMQCKGLMEIVIVTVLYQKGVIGQVTFSALVMVALITTAMTVPLARLCVRVWGNAATQTRAPEIPTPIPVPRPTPAAPAAPAGPRLVFDNLLGTIAVTKPEIVIGRHSADDIFVNDVRVSRHHARLKMADGTYEIVNQTAVRSEPNPILINNVAREHALLRDGDVVSIGGVTFTFRSKAA